MKDLEQFKEILKGIRNPGFQQLRSAIKTIDFTNEFLSANITEPQDLPYGRNVIWITEHIQAAIIHLPAYTETYIHDHGESIGCAIVLEGSLINAIYRLDHNHIPRSVSKNVVHRNDFFYAPKYQIHKMSNLNSERAVSFHVYSPSIQGAKTYDPVNEAVLTS